jgi:outer membrane protein assembly factor BamB
MTRLNQFLTSAPAFAENKIFAATSDNKLSVISTGTGESLANINAANRITKLIFQPPNRIYAGDKQGGISAYDSTNNINLWKIRAGGAQISAITPSPMGLLISSFDNYIYLLSPNGGRRIWKRRLSGRISFEPLIYEKFAVVATLFDPSAAIVELKSGKIINRIVLEPENFFRDGFLVSGNLIVSATADGLTAFADSTDSCRMRSQ